MTSTVTDRIHGADMSLAIKAPVRASTTAAIALSGLQTIDGVVLASGDRVLVKDQASATSNGIYNADTGTWTRARDFDGNRDIAQGTLVAVTAGTTNGNTYWRVSTANPITVGTTTIAFVRALFNDLSLVSFLQAGTGAVLRAAQDKMRECVSVKDFGAMGDKSTDDLAAFNLARDAAKTLNLALYIPGLAPGYYYKLSNVWTLTDCDSMTIFGDGVSSLLVIANAAGANCLTLNSTIHATIRDIGIYGTAGSGNGIELTNSSHYNKFSNIWLGWCDGDGIKVTSGQSNTFTDCDVDQNVSYTPATLIGGLVNGSIKHGVRVMPASGNTNNQSFVNCRINAAGATYSLKVGDSAVGDVESFNWTGGLIQGSSVFKEVYLCAKDALIIGAHIEPPVGATANYVVTMDGCTNTHIEGGTLAGDASLITCVRSGLTNVRGSGIDLTTTCVDCIVRDGSIGNITTGPAGGVIKDRGVGTIIDNVAWLDRVRPGKSIRNATLYFESDMEKWVGGGSPTVPCGFTSFGTPTITRESGAGLVRSGTYSAKVVHSSSSDEGFKIDIEPANSTPGRRIYVEAWVQNESPNTTARIQLVEGGTGGTAGIGSFQGGSGVYERIACTFIVNASATSATIQFSGIIGTTYWQSIKIWLEEHVPVTSMTLADSATPSVSKGGVPVKHLTTNSGGTTITGFTDPHVGEEIIVTLGANTDFTDSATLQLAGGVNFTTGVTGDVVKFIYGNDGVWRETGRSVN